MYFGEISRGSENARTERRLYRSGHLGHEWGELAFAGTAEVPRKTGPRSGLDNLVPYLSRCTRSGLHKTALNPRRSSFLVSHLVTI